MKKLIFILLLGFITVGCSTQDNNNMNISTQIEEEVEDTDPNHFVEGRAYHDRGADTTICSEPFEEERFNKTTGEFDKTTYQHCWERRWEHEYTAGGERIPVWYWDDKSGTWYSFDRNGSYYSFKWIYKTKSILD